MKTNLKFKNQLNTVKTKTQDCKVYNELMKIFANILLDFSYLFLNESKYMLLTDSHFH